MAVLVGPATLGVVGAAPQGGGLEQADGQGR